MALEFKKEQENIKNSNSKIDIIAAKAYSFNDNHSYIVSEENQGITMKVSEIGIMGSTLSQYKLEEVRKHQNNHIEKRTELLIKEKRPKIDFK